MSHSTRLQPDSPLGSNQRRKELLQVTQPEALNDSLVVVFAVGAVLLTSLLAVLALTYSTLSSLHP